MSITLRRLMIAVVAGALLSPGPLPAAAVVGSAGPSEGAMVHGVTLQQGTNVFSGDVVEVGPGGEGVVTFGHNAMARFAEQSAVRATRDANSIGLELLRGRMVFRATPEQPVVGSFADAFVRAGSAEETVAIVAFRNPTLVAVTAEHGTLAVTAGLAKRTVEVPQGQTVEVTLSDKPPEGAGNPPGQQPAPGNAPPASKSNAALWVTGVVLAGGAVIGIALSQGQRQPQLTCPQKAALVSPFAFPCS